MRDLPREEHSPPPHYRLIYLHDFTRGLRCVVPARPIASAFDEVLVHRHAGFASSSFRAAITRSSLTSAGIFVSIFMISGLYTGDLNPIRTVPVLGTHKIPGPNAGGPRQFPIPTPLTARVGQFWRSPKTGPPPSTPPRLCSH
jgi:hypothetical protein